MPLLPFAALNRVVVGNHHSQSTLEKIFWPLPGSLSSSVTQFGSQNWIVRVGKVLVSEFFFVGWLCPQGGKRLFEYLGNWDYNFGFNCKPNLTAALFFTFFHPIHLGFTYIPIYHVYIVSS
jgi:hypothetical protein